MLMACNKGHSESVFVLYEAGFCIVSQLGQTGWQFNGVKDIELFHVTTFWQIII